MKYGELIDRQDVSDTNVGDTISRQAAIRWVKTECNPYGNPTLDFESGKKVIAHLEQMPSAQPDCSDCIKHGGDWDCDHVHCHKGESAQPEGWMEKNKERILQAGMEGREVEFWIGGRLFRIREVAQ